VGEERIGDGVHGFFANDAVDGHARERGEGRGKEGKEEDERRGRKGRDRRPRGLPSFVNETLECWVGV
jgi:hypothetical protein